MVGSILRPVVLRITSSRAFRSLATHPAVGWRAASRFVAGSSLDEAIDAAVDLGNEGIAAMLDHLGENVERDEQAIAAANAYIAAIERIRATPGLDCQISIKLTQLGLDRSDALCLAQVES
jgi:proline dehydrogenase